jgi:amino-acid N-acetyltransferase
VKPICQSIGGARYPFGPPAAKTGCIEKQCDCGRMRHTPDMSGAAWTFTEKSFYLAEFRRRSLGVALPLAVIDAGSKLEAVMDELVDNGTRCVLLTPARSNLAGIGRLSVLQASETDWVARLWHAQQAGQRVALELDPARFAAACREAALRLRLAKLVWIDERGGLFGADGARISMVDVADLDRMLVEPDAPHVSDHADLLAEIRPMLANGLPSVSLCSLKGLEDELFTYAGSGTFFTRERYAEVRRLALDDFDAAADLIRRGVEEGYLAPRENGELDGLLGSAFGVFIEGRYLAGIGSLVPHVKDRAGEIAGLYTLTRFVGEGVGRHLVRFALELAAEAGYAYVFACTTSERVEAFFWRHGFTSVSAQDLPASKWRGYPPERRARLRCLKRDIDAD